MRNNEINIYLSDLDEKRFGCRTAKVNGFKSDHFNQAIDFCNENDVDLLIARCDPRDISVVHAMELNGFLLMDTLAYYKIKLNDENYICSAVEEQEPLKNFNIRTILPGEEKIVENVARKAFDGHIGHYHVDDKLDNKHCTEVYASWAYNCCMSKEFADKVFVALVNSSIAGFAVLKELPDHEWQGVLMGVLPEHHKSGIGRALTVERIKYCLSNGGRSMIIPVSIANIPIQKTLQKLNFHAFRFEHTFHKWFV